MSIETRPGRGSRVVRFLLFFLGFQIPMVIGALVCYLLGRLVPPSSSVATLYHPGTFLFAIGDVLFLSMPVVSWMVLSRHGWAYSLEMGIAMIVPVAAIMLVGQLAAFDYLRWLLTAGYPAMGLGMLVYMVYRRNHFTGRMGRSAHT